MSALADDDEVLLRYGQEETFTNKAWKAVEKDVQHLLEILEEKPEQAGNLGAIHHEGTVYRSKSRNPQWKEVRAVLDRDEITFYKMDGTKKGSMRISYVFTTKQAKEDELVGRTSLNIKQRIIVISPDDVCQIASENEDDTKRWLSEFRRLLRAKYTPEELKNKEEAKKDLQPLLIEQERMKAQKYHLIMKTLTESGFFISPKVKKEKEGYLELKRAGKEWKKLYVVLLKDFIYLFKPHEKVSVDTRPYDWVDLQYVTSVRPSRNLTHFVVRTMMRKFVFQAKHDIGVTDWVNEIRGYVEKKTGRILPKLRQETDSKGYLYTKSLDDRMSVTYTVGDKTKTKKLPKTKEVIIGRSSSATLTITEDKFISRSHCRIVVEENVPYVIDMGTNAGTKLNGVRVTKSALAPGDIIQIGHTKFVFQVKDSELIFNGPMPQRSLSPIHGRASSPPACTASPGGSSSPGRSDSPSRSNRSPSPSRTASPSKGRRSSRKVDNHVLLEDSLGF